MKRNGTIGGGERRQRVRTGGAEVTLAKQANATHHSEDSVHPRPFPFHRPSPHSARTHPPGLAAFGRRAGAWAWAPPKRHTPLVGTAVTAPPIARLVVTDTHRPAGADAAIRSASNLQSRPVRGEYPPRRKPCPNCYRYPPRAPVNEPAAAVPEHTRARGSVCIVQHAVGVAPPLSPHAREFLMPHYSCDDQPTVDPQPP
jgi:hypothetical protein